MIPSMSAGTPFIALAEGDGHGDHSAHGHASKAEAVDKVEVQEPIGNEAVIAEQLPTYPLSVCLASGEELGSMGDPITIVHEGQEIKFCCDSCLPKFKKDPAKYLAKLHGGSGPSDSSGMSGHNH